MARAQIEYYLKDDPSFQLKVDCADCRRESRYSLDAIVGMIPVSRRPRALRANEMQLLLLLEAETDTSMADRAFFGERVLADRRTQTPSGGLAELRTTPAMAPDLVAGDVVRFEYWGRYPVGRTFISSAHEFPLRLELGRTSNAIGAYFAAKHVSTAELRPGNIFCSNPSCSMVFSLTYSGFLEVMEQAQARAPSLGAASAITLLSCLVCGTSRVVDEHTFDGLVKM
jgi:hypothetical protein